MNDMGDWYGSIPVRARFGGGRRWLRNERERWWQGESQEGVGLVDMNLMRGIDVCYVRSSTQSSSDTIPCSL
jgi:hypothetical protein